MQEEDSHLKQDENMKEEAKEEECKEAKQSTMASATCIQRLTSS